MSDMMATLRANRTMLILVGAALLAAYVWYFLDGTKATSILRFAWSFSIPLVLGALTGIIGERSGLSLIHI